MDDIESGRPAVSWEERVRFAPGGAFAYRPGELLVAADAADQAEITLRAWAEAVGGAVDFFRDEGLIAESFVRFRGSFSPAEAMRELHERGLLAQVNHVLFATSCCPPHPADPCAEDFYANPFYAHMVSANPFFAHSFYANPFYAHSVGANPFYAHSGSWRGCGCGCAWSMTANPFYAHTVSANPFYAHASPSPFVDTSSQLSGRRRSSARPAQAPTPSKHKKVRGVHVTILDTGWAHPDYEPKGLPGINVNLQGRDQPDEDRDGYLDPAAGHGTFIAGIIEQLAPGCRIELIQVLSTFGDGDEAAIADTLSSLARRPDDERPDIVSLSFGGYSPLGMWTLTKAITSLRQSGTVVVASAGNDATCSPLYPAALENVVGVGALDEAGKPATYTNYGPWVDACAPGTNLVSLFFDGFNGPGLPVNNYDPDAFVGWARWSGTSFAAPVVTAVLARELDAGLNPREAVAKVIEDPNLNSIPMLGTVVDPTK